MVDASKSYTNSLHLTEGVPTGSFSEKEKEAKRKTKTSLKEKIKEIKELLRIHPEFSKEWTLRDENIVVTPDTQIVIDDDNLDRVERKLYADLISSVLNILPELIEHIEYLETDNAAQRKELAHFASAEKKGRIRGMREISNIISSTKAISPTSRDVLQELIFKVADALEAIKNETIKQF